MGIAVNQAGDTFHLYNQEISYIMKVLPNRQLGQIYFGKRIRIPEDCSYFLETSSRPMSSCVFDTDNRFSMEHIRQEYDPETGRWELKFQPPEVNVGSREYEAVLYVPQKLKKLELDAGMGSALIADLELEILELESGMGSIKLENVVSASSDLSAEMGSITGTADLGGTNEISCDMGSVELSVPAPVEYRAVVENSMGSVKIGSDEFTAEGKQSYGPQSADVVYQIECSMGSVELKF